MILPEKRKQLEYDLTAAETAVREQDFDLPIAWATLFLLDKESIIAKNCPKIAVELGDIVDWIKNGDPETRDND